MYIIWATGLTVQGRRTGVQPTSILVRVSEIPPILPYMIRPSLQRPARRI